jgi:exopolysaccharide biosynthesis polyprenyl glycosylphosphotransferase
LMERSAGTVERSSRRRAPRRGRPVAGTEFRAAHTAPARGPTARELHAQDRLVRRALVAVDAVAIAAALALAELLVAPNGAAVESLVVALLTLPLWLGLFKLYGLYDRDAKRISHSTIDDLPHLIHALVLGSLGLWLFTKVALPHRLELAQGAAFFFGVLALILTGRTAVRSAVAPRVARDRVLLIGAGRMAEVLLRKIRTHPEYGLDPVGYLAPSPSEHGVERLSYLGDPLGDLESVSRAHGVQRVVVLASEVGDDVLIDVVRACSELGLKVGVVPNLVEVLGSAVETDDVEGVSVLGMSPPEFSRSSRWVKRAMDVALAAMVLVVAAPVMLLASIAIKLTSRGPILFSQERIGRAGRRFRIHKFRTMIQDAEAHEAKLKQRSRHSAWLDIEDDPRITSVGRFLRYTSIDELPQLFNVLKGDMSLVGPRPVTPAVDEHISGWGRRRLDLTPGVTGLWQVLGRTWIPFEEMVNLDYLYVTNWSLWTDLRLLVRTVPTVLRQRGVN